MSGDTNHSDGDESAVPSNPLSGIESEKRRADVMANNCKWLVDKIDRIHDALCPDICGTWQQRATDAVAEAQKARKQMDELHACLKEAMEWCKPCNYEHEPWLRWAKARDSHKPKTKAHFSKVSDNERRQGEAFCWRLP